MNIDTFTIVFFLAGLVVLVAVRLFYWNPRIANGTARETATGRNVRATLLAVSFALAAFALAFGLVNRH